MEQQDLEKEDEFIVESRKFLRELFSTLPKNYISVVNIKRHREADIAMEKTKQFFGEICDEDNMPTFTCEYDPMIGTALGFDIILNEFGVEFMGAQLKSIMRFIPDGCIFFIVPQKDYKCCISLSFDNVKEIVAILE